MSGIIDNVQHPQRLSVESQDQHKVHSALSHDEEKNHHQKQTQIQGISQNSQDERREQLPVTTHKQDEIMDAVHSGQSESEKVEQLPPLESESQVIEKIHVSNEQHLMHEVQVKQKESQQAVGRHLENDIEVIQPQNPPVLVSHQQFQNNNVVVQNNQNHHPQQSHKHQQHDQLHQHHQHHKPHQHHQHPHKSHEKHQHAQQKQHLSTQVNNQQVPNNVHKAPEQTVSQVAEQKLHENYHNNQDGKQLNQQGIHSEEQKERLIVKQEKVQELKSHQLLPNSQAAGIDSKIPDIQKKQIPKSEQKSISEGGICSACCIM